MSAIRFLRRIISLHTLRPGGPVSEVPPKLQPLSESHNPALTQKPLVTEMLQGNGAHQHQESKAVCLRPVSKVLYSESAGDDLVVRSASRVHWKFVQQGTSLICTSIDGDVPAIAGEDATFERKAFIDGVTYLLMALPKDLNICELRQIKSALPDCVIYLDLGAVQSEANSTQSAPGPPRSILHRSVQRTVVNLIFFFGFLLPYLSFLLRYAARMERKHKVSETIVGCGLNFVNSIGKRSIYLTQTMCQLNDGRVGQALPEALIWTVDGVAQGASDGLGEGLSIVRARSTVRAEEQDSIYSIQRQR
ncbi:hypothetical protein THAR02_08763 [Trichoderma harzianum]|uniref:Uncharacterized protein n=1 Tax=Trichoderma harzianum TaxID=5544 RepID=A0A0F9X3A6_TRIHA|nr:hypothetical protein THAR02_08763 [Trichoderma harzianum]